MILTPAPVTNVLTMLLQPTRSAAKAQASADLLHRLQKSGTVSAKFNGSVSTKGRPLPTAEEAKRIAKIFSAKPSWRRQQQSQSAACCLLPCAFLYKLCVEYLLVVLRSWRSCVGLSELLWIDAECTLWVWLHNTHLFPGVSCRTNVWEQIVHWILELWPLCSLKAHFVVNCWNLEFQKTSAWNGDSG